MKKKLKKPSYRLARIGYDDVIGFLAEECLPGERNSMLRMLVHRQQTTIINNHTHQILDVRKPAEVEAAHVLALNIFGYKN